ncbi:CHAD domain-containing protein [Mycolicibacterium wolinskyi]|uniref:CHAD domain-containing protein n=1 Tax=Mycolicibacterium wolinskyi TaxID=59750 RepID=UPI00082F76C4|nr:CHAD domain-containing protein [Mycolicibacterium wolinskyi]
MVTISRAFSTQGAVTIDAVAEALQPKYTLNAEPARAVSRTWIDTFDWRLHDAGISLRFVDDRPLTAQLPDGTQLQCPVAPKWPAMAENLPAGRLREVLSPIIEPRALIPVVAVQGTVQECRVLNSDEKTVARLLIEHGDNGVGWLQVLPLRGYDSDGERIAAGLSAVDGLTPAQSTSYDDALAHAERKPQGRAEQFTPETPAAVAVAAVLQRFAEAIADNVDGTIAAIDIEFLHDLRVAVRRTRSILKLVGDVLPDGLAERFVSEFKWLGDLTTPVRDLDVYLHDFDGMAAGLTSADPADLAPFQTFLRKHRTAERRILVRGLRSRRFERLMQDWQAELARVAEETASGQTVSDLARERVGKVFRKVAKRGEAITAESPSEDVHSLRKRCKELRYLLEVFRPLHAEEPHRRLVKELKALQDTLGDFQDGEVQREAVREFAAAMMDEGSAPPATVLAMGELAAQLDAHQLRARSALVGRLQPFLARENRDRVKALIRR